VKDEVQYGLFLLFISCILQTGSEELLALGGSAKGINLPVVSKGFKALLFLFSPF